MQIHTSKNVQIEYGQGNPRIGEQKIKSIILLLNDFSIISKITHPSLISYFTDFSEEERSTLPGGVVEGWDFYEVLEVIDHPYVI